MYAAPSTDLYWGYKNISWFTDFFCQIYGQGGGEKKLWKWPVKSFALKMTS